MKRFILFAVSLVLLFTLIGCSQGDGNLSTTTPADVSNDEKSAEVPYYGQWQIVRVLAFAPASTYSNEDINALIGKRLTYSEESAACFGDSAEYINNTAANPVYQITVISRADFEANNRVAFDKLGITGDSVIQVEAADAKGNGSTFFIKDNNTLILSGGGVYLELSRLQD